ncbi:MAG: hypothetical protein CVT59_07115 [Actinobacteria bacterium HGW-Actinobacteria-1]|jgi:hypothetical protein|nr:MAG: hypothetical protein CVT59_07115 [Actinobacteria bacterium HGW-Actinobacteria-1]
MKSRWITVAVLVLALVFAASPAIAGGQGSGEPAKVQSGGDTVAPGAGDVLQDRTRDQLQDGSCSEDCDGPSTCTEDGSATKTQTRLQTQTQTQTRLNASDETSGVATMTRETTRARVGQDADEVVVEGDAVVPEPEETQEATRAGNLLGAVIETMAQFAVRVFAWLGLV